MFACKAVLLILLSTLWGAEAARILAVLPYNARSHFFVMEPLLLALHAKGHELTVVSTFPRQQPLKNYRDIDLSSALPPVVSNFTVETLQQDMPHLFQTTLFIIDLHMKVCDRVMKEEQVLSLLNEKFDLMIGEIFGSDCFNYFAHKLKIPLVSWVTSTALPWIAARSGLPDNPSYIPNYFMDYDAEMSFTQRVFNWVTLLYAKTAYHIYSQIPSQNLAEDVFREKLSYMNEVNKQTSLVLINSHFSLSQSRPLPPNVVEVGGIHIKETKPLPEDLKEILDSAKDGAILFSFGSLVRVASLPRPIILMFMNVFATMSQKVILKYEEELAEAPPNVLIRKWLPQADIIAHPNVRAVVTHGGLASTIEAVYFAKPLVGVPLYSDQFQNVNSVVNRGAGVILDIHNLSQRVIFDAFSRVLDDPRYLDNMMRLSLQYRDRPMTALQSAVYWTEYVIRHKGAPHLQPASVKLPLYQYLLLDVITLVLAALAATLCALFITVRLLCLVVCGRRKSATKTQKYKRSKKTD